MRFNYKIVAAADEFWLANKKSLNSNKTIVIIEIK